MLRSQLFRVTFSTHASYPLHRLFSNYRVSLMESESTGTHKDPVTGEMISKQCVHIGPNGCAVLIDPPCAGNSSVAKSSVKRRQIFRLMYVAYLHICVITRR